jgi:hypothetical protein
MNGCRLDDDGGPEVVAVEAGGQPQALWVRVGAVFDGGGQRDKPGVWIDYQDHYLQGPIAGPVLLTPAVWRELNRAVERRLARRIPLWRRWRIGASGG